MSEKVNVNQEEQENTVATKKPAAKKQPETKTEKPGVFKRIGNWFKSHKKELIAGAVGFGVGAGTAVGAGIASQKIGERKAQEQMNAAAYMPEDPNSLDPNV